MAGQVLGRLRVLPRSFFARPADVLAPDLLNKVLVVGSARLRLVEVEAYLHADDDACHATRGRTRRNATMFGPPGLLYVYFTYGMHHCANVVCARRDQGAAVLVRAGVLEAGHDEVAARRLGVPARDWCRGPGRLCAALGLDRAFDGLDLVAAERGVWVGDDGTAPPERPLVGPRVGISAATSLPLRFGVPGSAVSRPFTATAPGPRRRDRPGPLDGAAGRPGA